VDDNWNESATSAVSAGTPADRLEKRPYLLVLSGPQFGQIFMLEQGRELVIGRKDGADILIRDDGVSRRHASILAEGSEARIRDLGSQNGTFVDGVRVTDCRLDDGNRISASSPRERSTSHSPGSTTGATSWSGSGPSWRRRAVTSDRFPSCSSTSTTSRRSTTPMATWPATRP
jgi:pSer/pThr/pTyr-binding forkhead associated (FHA) protein